MSASLTVLDNFDGADGTDPRGNLITDANGDLFGVASYGGPSADGKIGGYGDGTVFEITYNATTGYATTPTLLAAFNSTDGGAPSGGLIADANGDLFGTTLYGGANGGGTVFEIVKTAAGYASTPTVLANLDATAHPRASLIIDAQGNLFGTTTNDGTYGGGTVFEIAKTATGYAAATTLTSFSYFNGEVPEGNLIMDSAGDLIGTTDQDGTGDGTVFELDKYASSYASTPTVLANFNGANGFGIMSGLVADANGDLFGTSGYGGADNGGAIYEIAKTPTGYSSTPIVVASFPTTPLEGGAGGYLPAYPAADLIIDSNGDLYGTTTYGGTNDDGTVFEIVKTATGYNSTPVILASLTMADGDLSTSNLVSLANGGLIGTAEEGGASNAGTVFEVTPPPPSGPDTFSHVQASASGPLAGYYLWSDAKNWNEGVPTNNDAAASAVAGVDDIASLSLASLDLTGGGTVSATGQLTIQNLIGAAGAEALASTRLPGGSGSAIVTAYTLSGSGGEYGAVDSGAIFDDESATSPGDAHYLASSGGKLIVANALTIGGDSSGILEIVGGGTVTSGSAYIGTGSGSGIVTVDGTGSTWAISGQLAIGVLGAADAPTVTISDHASVTSSVGSVDEDHLQAGTLTIETGAALTEIELEMSRTATLNVDSGATLSEYAAAPNLSYVGLLGNGQMNFDGGTLASANEQTNIGQVAYFQPGNGTLTASDGAVASNLATDIGIDAGDTGTLILTGTSTSWADTYNSPVDDNNAGLVVGQSGNGTLLVEAGATLTNPLSYIKIGQYAGATGAAEVTGNGSTLSAGGLLRIGDSGHGTLSVGAGGAVAAGQVQIGDFAGGIGALTINTGGELTTNAASSIDTGPQNGGDVVAGSFDIGVQSGAQGNVLVNGGTIGVGGDLTVGDGGTGSLAVDLGGVVTSVNGNIGTGAGNSGMVSIDSASVWNMSGSLTVGQLGGAGSPSLVIEDGSSVSNANHIDHLYDGSVLIAGNSRLTAHTFDMHEGATLTIESGATLAMAQSPPANDQDEDIGLRGNGTIILNAATLAAPNAYTIIGDSKTSSGPTAGTLIASAGAIATNLATDLGELAGDSGTLILTGKGTDWTDGYGAPLDSNDSGLNIGTDGAGSLTVAAGATLTNPLSYIKIGEFAKATGEALVTGPGSTLSAGGLLRIGDSGAGTLDIEDAASVTAGQVQIGDYANSTGTLTIGHGGRLSTNAASLIDVGPQRITGPNDSVGTLQVAAGSFDIGVQRGATGVVDVDGGALTVQGELIIGNAGSGSLYVRNADVTANSVEIGAAGGVGSVTLASFADLIAGSVRVGGLGTVILEGGELDPPNSVTIDAAGDITGYGTIAGSVGNAGSITATGGTLELTGAIGGTGEILIDTGAELRADAAIAAGQTVRFNGNAATLALGDAADFSGTIANFVTGDVIDFEKLSITGPTTLTLGANDVLSGVIGGENLHLSFSGAPPGTQFVFAPNASGGTTVQKAAAPIIDIFSDNVAGYDPTIGLHGYLWSDAANWSEGLPANGDVVQMFAAGYDDFAGLTLSGLDLADPSDSAVYGVLNVLNGLSVGTLTISSSVDFGLNGNTTDVMNIGSISLVAGTGTAFNPLPVLSAGASGDVINDQAASEPAVEYLAATGGRIELAGSLNAGSELSYNGESGGTFALADPGPVIAAKLEYIDGGDVLELPGSTVAGIVFGASSMTITTDKGSFDFTNLAAYGEGPYYSDLSGYTVSHDAATGLEAITFTSPDAFSEKVVGHDPSTGLNGYFWSAAGNWSQGLPTNGDVVRMFTGGYDDIAGLTLSGLELADPFDSSVYGVLNVLDGLSVGTLTISAGVDLGLNGTTKDVLNIGSISVVPGTSTVFNPLPVLSAGGSGDVINDQAASEPAVDYLAVTGGRIELAGSLNAGSKLSYNDASGGTFALADPGPVIAAALLYIEGGDVLELPGSAVRDIVFGASSMTITTDKGSFDFIDLPDYAGGSYDSEISGYTVSHDSATGLEAITFSGTAADGISLSETGSPSLTITPGESISGSDNGIDNSGDFPSPWTIVQNGTVSGGVNGIANSGTLGGWTIAQNGNVTGGSNGISNSGSVAGGWTVTTNGPTTGTTGTGLVNSGTVTGGWNVTTNDPVTGGTNGIANTGSIGGSWNVTANGSVTGATGDGIDNSGTVTGGWNLKTNAAVTGGVDGIADSNGFATIVNTGAITGHTGAGIRLADGGVITNRAGGKITGDHFGIIIDDGTIINAGTISGATGPAIAFTGAGSNRLIVDPGAVFAGASTANAAGSNTLELAAGGAGTLAGLGTTFSGFSHIIVDRGADWHLTGANTLAAGYTLDDFGTLTTGAFTNNGIISADPSVLVFDGPVTGDGTIEIGAGSDAVFDAGVAATETIDFPGAAGTLTIDDPSQFDGLITGTGPTGFTAGDAIALNLPYSPADRVSVSSPGVVTVFANGHDYDLHIAGATVGETDFKITAASSGIILTRNPATTPPVIVGRGKTVSNLTIGAGGSEFLLPNATANNITITSGGVQAVLPGASSNHTTIDGGVQGVAGFDQNSDVNHGGDQLVGLGGETANTTVHQGGYEYVLLGGTADNTTIAAGGTMLVGIGGQASGGVTFAGSDAVLSLAGTSLPTTQLSGFSQNDAIILTGFTYAAGHDTATLGAGGVLTLDLNGAVKKLDFNPAQTNAGHHFEVTTNSLDQVVIIDPLTGASPNMNFLAPATAAGSSNTMAQILGRSAGLILDIFEHPISSAAFQPALKNFAAIDTPAISGASLASLNLPGLVLSIIKHLTPHPT